MEYASFIWDPLTHKNKLEMVQRRAARLAVGDYKTTHNVRKMLNELQWPTIEERRKRAKVTILYKGTHRLVETVSDSLVPTTRQEDTS